MWCKLFFYFDENESKKKLTKKLKEIKEPFQIITDSLFLTESLNKIGFNSGILDNIVPEKGSTVNEVDKFSKKLLNDYRLIFQNIRFNECEIFVGFEYQLLRQLHLLGRTKKILESKKNTIFVFDRFYFVYFVILKLASNMGYDSDLKIGFLNKGKIEYLSSTDKDSPNYNNRFSFIRATHFLKSTYNRKISWNRIKSISQFSRRILSLIMRLLVLKTVSLVSEDPMKGLLKALDKKLLRKNSYKKVECAFFITASREDLFFKPLFPIFDVLKKEKKGLQLLLQFRD